MRAATSRRCSRAICCGCTCATPSGTAGRPSCSTRSRPIWAASSPRPWPYGPASRPIPCGAGSSTRAECTACSGYRPPSRRGASTPRRPACGYCPRPRTSTSRSIRMTCASTCSVRPGPGGQSVNTTDSAVRITHVPTGTVVSMQNEKSQLQNREAGLRVLRARLLAAAQEEAESAADDARRSQVRTVDRSERVRTYNFPENRISDHRVGFKAYNLDQVIDGALDDVIDALVARGRRGDARGIRRVVSSGRATRRGLLDTATERLRAAGVASPRVDAELLLAHCLGVERSRLPLVDDVPDATAQQFTALVERRTAREPLQYICGRAAFRHIDLLVGPGVFVPRPETELLVDAVLPALAAIESPAGGRPVRRQWCSRPLDCRRGVASAGACRREFQRGPRLASPQCRHQDRCGRRRRGRPGAAGGHPGAGRRRGEQSAIRSCGHRRRAGGARRSGRSGVRGTTTGSR